MSFKDKISSILFRPKKEEEPDETLLEEQTHIPQEAPEIPAAVPDDPTHLEMPADHPIRQLHELRQKEAGALPYPRLCMDEDGTFPSELLDKEKNRLQASLKSVCGTRWKAAKGRTRGKHSKKKAESEAPPAEEEELVMDARLWFHLSTDKI